MKSKKRELEKLSAKAEWRGRLCRADGSSVFCPRRSILTEITTRKEREMERDDKLKH